MAYNTPIKLIYKTIESSQYRLTDSKAKLICKLMTGSLAGSEYLKSGHLSSPLFYIKIYFCRAYSTSELGKFKIEIPVSTSVDFSFYLGQKLFHMSTLHEEDLPYDSWNSNLKRTSDG